MKNSNHFLYWLVPGVIFLILYFFASPSSALNLDGEGHYSLIGRTETNPSQASDRGMYQAINQNFRLLGEARVNEKTSVFLEFRIFDNTRAAYLGDQAKPRECAPSYRKNGDVYQRDDSCEGRHQSTGEPGYASYVPRVTQVYAKYAFDYCLLEAGRRGRDWGLGILLDSGRDPFDTDASIFDGVSCTINNQKSQTLGFGIGFDKLAETGSAYDSPYEASEPPNDADVDAFEEGQPNRYGATNIADDLDQFTFNIVWDDRKANEGAFFTKTIGMYFANVLGHSQKTDIKFLDLYTGFFLPTLFIQNELVFRLGKSLDPNWRRYGGRMINTDEPSPNKLDTIGLAGNIEWVLSSSGAYIGPEEYNKGDISKHSLILDYAYAPGDKDGYYSVDNDERPANRATAIAFHRNYKPALILFNAPQETDDLRVDGIYDPGRVMNTTLIGFGYRYRSLSIGNFDVEFFTAQLNEKMPGIIKDAQAAQEVRQIGYAGKQLGYELDVKYSKSFGKEIDVGLAAGGILAGKAWKVTKSAPANNFILQGTAAFKF